MNVQFSDLSGMLMRHVSNYISKYKDSQTTKSLHSAQAAYCHLCNMKPCEPEMVITLSSIKMAWSNSTKSYVPLHLLLLIPTQFYKSTI